MAASGPVGLEPDRVFNNGQTPARLTVLAASPLHFDVSCPRTGRGVSNATVYTAPSGAQVFDTWTFQWS